MLERMGNSSIPVSLSTHWVYLKSFVQFHDRLTVLIQRPKAEASCHYPQFAEGCDIRADQNPTSEHAIHPQLII